MSLYESFLLLNMFRMLLHSSSGADDCMWVYCSVSVCTGVLVLFGWSRVVSECRLEHGSTVRFVWGGVASLCRLKHYSLYLYSTTKMMHGPINIRFTFISFIYVSVSSNFLLPMTWKAVMYVNVANRSLEASLVFPVEFCNFLYVSCGI